MLRQVLIPSLCWRPLMLMQTIPFSSVLGLILDHIYQKYVPQHTFPLVLSILICVLHLNLFLHFFSYVRCCFVVFSVTPKISFAQLQSSLCQVRPTPLCHSLIVSEDSRTILHDDTLGPLCSIIILESQTIHLVLHDYFLFLSIYKKKN